MGNRRMMAKLSSLLTNTSHPLQDTLTALGSSFSERLLHPRCVKESQEVFDSPPHPLVGAGTVSWSRMAWGRNDLLSLSVEQDSDNSLSLKLLLCLEMVLCSG
ncbi:hypothetical protein L3Q82_005076 [Scortum barcoo]|uniref:Uncharacterized protein n=1 Tax=Scortum barcoo TaxID=214431 RepID=A0ACB8VE76_9TELE|nr:hypothetical protein L3Q82_005076 [Scortum barcoo]